MTTTATPKRGGMGRNILIVVIVLIVACVVCVGAVFVVGGPAITKVFNSIAAPLTASQDFMTAVQNKDFTKAYDMVHPSQQQSFGGSAQGMQQLFESNGWEPTSFALNNIQVGGDAIVNGTGNFGGNTKYIYVNLRKDGDNWKILGLEISNNAPTATPSSGS